MRDCKPKKKIWAHLGLHYNPIDHESEMATIHNISASKALMMADAEEEISGIHLFEDCSIMNFYSDESIFYRINDISEEFINEITLYLRPNTSLLVDYR